MTMGMFFWVKKVVSALIVAADGSGDYTDIQSAIDALPATGGEIHVKAGTYIITTGITINKSNVTIVGSGFSTIIQTTSNISIFYASSKTNIDISNLYILGAGAGHTDNLAFEYATVTYSKIKYCKIDSVGSFGVYLSTTSSNNIISNNIISNCVYDGIYTSNGTNNLIINNTCTSNGFNGIRCDFGTEIIHGNFCYSNTLSGILVGQTTSVNSAVTSNVCNSNAKYGIYIFASAANTVVSNNTCKLNTIGQILDEGSGTQIGHNITS